MKLLTKTLLGLSAAALMGGSASAAELHIVGSTAFRPAATAAIIAYIQSVSPDGKCYGGYAGTSGSAGTNTGLYGGGVQIFETSDSGATATVATFWTGSAGGLVDLVSAGVSIEKFLTQSSLTIGSTSLITPTATGTGGAYGIQIASSNETDTSAPQASFSDSFSTTIATAMSSSTISRGHTVAGASTGPLLALAINNAAPAEAGNSLNSAASSKGAVGIVPFAWYTGYQGGTASPITNVTQANALALLTTGAGGTPLSLFTGNAGDITSRAYLIGRNEDSGTRIAALSEAQLPTPAVAQVIVQWMPTFSNNQKTGNVTTATGLAANFNTGGAGAAVTGIAEFTATSPLYTQQFVNWNLAGHSGYASGGDVANVLLADNTPLTTATAAGQASGTSAYLIGYLGWADGYSITSQASTTVAGGSAGPGTQISFNGITPSVTAIANGQYDFWTYEHLYILTGAQANAVVASGSATAPGTREIADGIADGVYTTYACTNGNGATAASDVTDENALVPPVAGILNGTGILVKRTVEGGVLTTF